MMARLEVVERLSVELERRGSVYVKSKGVEKEGLGYLPFHSGLRFSRNALTPSLKSSVVLHRVKASAS